MRHAKSSWKSGASDDHSRPLNKRGRRDAPRIGEALVDLGWSPQRVLSSDSERTRQTWSLMSGAFNGPQVSFTRDLYLAGPSEVEEAVGGLPTEVDSVMVLGHNYGWEGVVKWLCGEDVRLTTANAALLEGQGDSWEDALADAPSWTLHRVLRPKEL